MGPTETRSRDEWLAEVQRRGTRIRRRRRVGAGILGALALVLPVSVTASLLGGGSERAVELSVAGPGAGGAITVPPSAADELPPGALPPLTAPATERPTTTIAEVHRRVSAVNGVFVTPSVPTSVVPADDPVVRSTTTLAPPVAPPRPVPGPAQSTAAGAASSAAAAPCPPEALQIDVVPSKASFALGEMVKGTGFVQTIRAANCLVPVPASFRIEDVASGRVVGSSVSVTEHTSPLTAEPGKMYTSTFTWDQKDCSGAICSQVPAGLYQAVAQWTDGGPYRGWGEFRIGG